ncbi:unnamed protein product [Cochlearia groenlandica]
MATEEMKQETEKTEEKQSQQVKDLPLPYKTCNIKVSIHCEGCKRKVKKILTSIEGVYRVDIDMKQQKVTVTGIVTPDILLKKLLKSVKNADIIPELPDPVHEKPIDPKEKSKKNTKNDQKPEITNASTPSGTAKPDSDKPAAAGKCNSGDGGEASEPVKEEKKEVVKEKDTVPAESPLPVESPSPATTTTEEEKKAEESSGNIGKKKKKKKAVTRGSVANNPTDGPARTGSLPLTTPITPEVDPDRPFTQNDGHHIVTNNNLPRHDMYAYPLNYCAPQIMYGASYNVAQPPVSVDGSSYYSPATPNSYAYMHPGYQPYDQSHYPSRPSDSFELFSDENPNGCSVM